MKQWKTISDYSPIEIKNEDERNQKIIEVLLQNREIKGKKNINEFLHPELSSVTPNNVGIDEKELAKSIRRVKKAIKEKETIVVYGDYDVDGISGTAILWEKIYKMYKNVIPYIPHRVDEGYGLSEKGIDHILSSNKNIGLIITIDNGIVAHDAVAYANKKKIDVIITDHHVKGKDLPKAYSIVHTTQICGAAVGYLFSLELAGEKIEDGKNDLDLVALATVADLVPLKQANRVLVKYGIEQLHRTKRVGLLALFQEAGIKQSELTTYHIGHMIAPRINAAGRIVHGMDSLRLLCTKDAVRARKLATHLGETNRQRQILTEEAAEHARNFMVKENLVKIAFAYDTSYNEGVVGLVASRLVELYYRPSFALSVGDEFTKGSARSIPGVNIIEMIRSLSHLTVAAGGHPMAAGFTIKTENIEEFKSSLEVEAGKVITDDMLTRTLSIDMMLPLKFITKQLHKSIYQLSPFGMANHEPVFGMKGAIIEDIKVLGRERKHLKLIVSEEGMNPIEALAFSYGDMVSELHIGDKLNIAYTIDENVWNGSSKLQVKIKDLVLT